MALMVNNLTGFGAGGGIAEAPRFKDMSPPIFTDSKFLGNSQALRYSHFYSDDGKLFCYKKSYSSRADIYELPTPWDISSLSTLRRKYYISGNNGMSSLRQRSNCPYIYYKSGSYVYARLKNISGEQIGSKGNSVWSYRIPSTDNYTYSTISSNGKLIVKYNSTTKLYEQHELDNAWDFRRSKKLGDIPPTVGYKGLNVRLGLPFHLSADGVWLVSNFKSLDLRLPSYSSGSVIFKLKTPFNYMTAQVHDLLTWELYRVGEAFLPFAHYNDAHIGELIYLGGNKMYGWVSGRRLPNVWVEYSMPTV